MQPERAGGVKDGRDKITLNVLQAELLAYGALGVAILSISFSAFFVRWANVPPQVMGFYRIGTIHPDHEPLFYSPHESAGRKGPPPWTCAGGFCVFPILAGLASAMDQFIWNASLKFTPAANATLLGNTSPLWVALIAWLIFRERTRSLFWLGLVLAMGGAAVVLGSDFLQPSHLGLGGSAFARSAFFYGLFYLFSQHSRQRLDTLSHVWLCSLSSTLLLLVICLVGRTPLVRLSNPYLPGPAGGRPPATADRLSGNRVCTRPHPSRHRLTDHARPAGDNGHPGDPDPGRKLTPPQWIGGLVALTGIYLVNRSREKPAEAELLDEADGSKGSAAEDKGRQAWIEV